ncbi:MAG TPA: DUF1207 domain-containing protein [Planctomycetia bacterium]|nr:DUF1207 domain-containing protein [Planctomycetia bacterium]
MDSQAPAVWTRIAFGLLLGAAPCSPLRADIPAVIPAGGSPAEADGGWQLTNWETLVEQESGAPTTSKGASKSAAKSAPPPVLLETLRTPGAKEAKNAMPRRDKSKTPRVVAPTIKDDGMIDIPKLESKPLRPAQAPVAMPRLEPKPPAAPLPSPAGSSDKSSTVAEAEPAPKVAQAEKGEPGDTGTERPPVPGKPKRSPKQLPDLAGEMGKPVPREQSPWSGDLAAASFRPLAALVIEGEKRAALAPASSNVWVSSSPAMPPQAIVPAPLEVQGIYEPVVQEYSDGTAVGAFWAEPQVWTLLPRTLLWEPPLANPREPRTFLKFGSPDGDSDLGGVDGAAGGQFGLVRRGPNCFENEGIQLDAFIAAFARFDGQEVVAADYRAGLPLTYAKGGWQAKIAYEYTSSQFGDSRPATLLLAEPDLEKHEGVLGLAYRWANVLRVYGQTGYAFSQSAAYLDERWRFNLGAEWSEQCPTGCVGQPFAALDLQWREDHDFDTDTSLQLGWQWRSEKRGRSPRIALEIARGRSPYGQLRLFRERWIGFAALWDW